MLCFPGDSTRLLHCCNNIALENCFLFSWQWLPCLFFFPSLWNYLGSWMVKYGYVHNNSLFRIKLIELFSSFKVYVLLVAFNFIFLSNMLFLFRNNFPSFKKSLIFTYMDVCLCAMYMQCQQRPERTLDFLGLEFQVVEPLCGCWASLNEAASTLMSDPSHQLLYLIFSFFPVFYFCFSYKSCSVFILIWIPLFNCSQP